MDEQKIQSLIEELQHLTRTMQRTSGSENNNADLIKALGLLSVRLSGKTRTANMETEAVKEFTKTVQKASAAVSKEAAAVNDNTAATERNTTAKEKSLSSEVYELNEKKRAYRQDIDTIKSHGAGILQLHNKSQALQVGFQALSATVKGVSGFMTGYAQALLNGERGAQVTAKNIEALSKPMLGLIGQVGSLAVQVGLGARGLNRIPGVSNLVNKALGKFAGNLATKSMIIGGAIAVTTAEVAKFGVEIVKLGAIQIDRLFDSFQKLSEVGIRGANGIEDVEGLMEELGMQTAHVEKFNNLLIQNSREIGMLGGTMMDGARTFTKLTGKMFGSEFGAKLMKLGMTQDQVNEAAIRSMAIQARSSSFLKKSEDERAASTAKFVIELDKATQLTGASRKEQAEALAAALQEKKFAAAMRSAERSGDTKKVEQLKIAQFMAAQAKLVGDIRGFTGILEYAAGGNTSEDAIAANSTYRVDEAMSLGLNQTQALQHMARSVELQQEGLDQTVAMIGDIKILQTDSVKSNEIRLRNEALLKGAIDKGFTGPDAIDRYLESEAKTPPKPAAKPGEPAAPPSKLDAMVDAARMQQQAALIMDKALGQISNTATIHSLATKQFSEAVNMFAKVGGIDAAKRNQISTERGKKEAEDVTSSAAKELAIKQAAFEKMKLDPQYAEAREKAENVAKIQVFKPSEEDIEKIAQQFLSKMPKYADGGIAKGPGSGHLAMLHGTEAVIPLAGGNIPVNISGAVSGGGAGQGEVGSGPAFSKASEMAALTEKVIAGIEKSNLYLKDILDEITGGATVGGAKAGGTSDMTAAMNAHDKGHQHEPPTVTPEAAQQLGKGIGSPLADLKVTSGFGMRTDPITGKQAGHGGVDLAGRAGDAIKAPEAGTARVVSEKDSGGYGNMVEILDSQGKVMHRMAHMSETMVKTGDKIEAGTDIGKVGSTGRSTGNHLHWEKFDPSTGKQIDPMAWLAEQQGKTPGFGTTGGGAATGNPQAARRGQNMGAPQVPMSSGPPASGYIGSVAEKYETGGRGSGTIGYDTTGGTSYGKYQIASKVGSMDAYIKHLAETNPAAAEQLKAAGPSDTGSTSGKFADTWKQLSASGALGNTESSFIKKQAYDPAMAGIKNKGLQDMIGGDKGLQEMLFSTATQHGAGGASGIMNKVFKEGMTKEDLVKATYAERGTRFGSSTPEVQKGVQNRFGREQQDILALMGQPGAVPGAPPTAVAGAAPPVTGFAPGAQTQPAQQPVTLAGMAQNILGSIFGGGTTAPSGIAGPTLPGPSTDMTAITQALQAQTTATQSAITSSMENMTNRLVESLGTAGGGGAGVAGAEVPGLLGDIVSAQRDQTAAINRLISVQTA